MNSATPQDAPLGEKHELPSAVAGAELVKRVPLSPAVGPYVLSDDEMRRTYRLASALSSAGIHKKVDGRMSPEAAFALILIGQDLGISATRALASLDIVKGNVQMRGVLLLAFVRESRRYDYRIVELDGETEVDSKIVEERESKQRATLRFFEILPDGSREQLHPDITYTMAMARKTGNVKDGSAWMSARRNMLLWRCASDGVKFHAPDLLGGIPVYTEADSFPEPEKALGEGTGDGRPVGIDLGPEVEKVIARATELGHAALADRATVEMTLGDQPPAKVVAWVKAANRELDDIPKDAEVIDGEPEALSGVLSSEPVQVGEDKGEAVNASQAPAHAREAGEFAEPTPEEQAAADELGEAIVSQGFLDDGPPRKAEPKPAPDPARIEALRRRGVQLLNDAEALRDAGDSRADEVFEEFERVSAEVEAASNADQLGLAL